MTHPHPHISPGGADGDDGDQNAELAHAGHEIGIQSGVVADVEVDQQPAWVQVLHLVPLGPDLPDPGACAVVGIDGGDGFGGAAAIGLASPA